jgi:DNA-binding transcriptional ArsR family regulator
MKPKQNMSPFLKALGDTPKLRVLDFLIDNDLFDYNLTEIARESNVSYNSLLSFFDDFIKTGIVIKTRKQGKSDLYKLNTDNLFVKHLIRLDVELAVGPLLKESGSELLEKEIEVK